MGGLPDPRDGIVAGGRGVRDEITEEAPGDDLERHLTDAPRFVVQGELQLWECRIVPGPEEPATTCSSPRRAHSRSMLCRGGTPHRSLGLTLDGEVPPDARVH